VQDFDPKHVTAVRNWLAEVKDLTSSYAHDWHIDHVDPSFARAADPLAAGGYSFRLACALRDEARLDVVVALLFSLGAATAAVPPDVSSAAALRAALDWSPPALYAFGRGREPWHPSQRVAGVTYARLMSERVFAEYGLPADAEFMAFRNASHDEFNRSLAFSR
jgi:hypothetical protein